MSLVITLAVDSVFQTVSELCNVESNNGDRGWRSSPILSALLELGRKTKHGTAL